MTSPPTIHLCFHGIGTPGRVLEPGEDRYWIAPELYAAIIDEVSERRDVRISFDDGNRSDVELGLEPLLRRNVNATFFVLAGRLDQPGSLGQDDLRTLRAHGMTIGSHGMDHRTWRGMDADTSRRELVEARKALVKASSGPVNEAALPMGQYDRSVLTMLRGLGYQAVHTSDRRWARQGSWVQPRFSVRHDDTVDSVRGVLRPPGRLAQWRAELKGTLKGLR